MNQIWQSEIVATFLMFLLALAAGSIFPVGSEWLFITLLAEGHVVWLMIVSATLGNTLGGWLTFLLGRYAKQKISKRQKNSSTNRWRYAEALYQRYGVWSLLLSWVPLLGDILVLIAGLLRAPTGLSLLLIFLGKAVRYALIAYVWQVGVQAFS